MNNKTQHARRLFIVIVFLIIALFILIARLIDLNIVERAFLLKQSQARILRKISIHAHRGMILDRLGVPLAISTPVESVWINPQLFKATSSQIETLDILLKLPHGEIQKKIQENKAREFLYIERRIPPPLAEKIKALHIQGLFFQPEYKRYYPEGEVTAHVVGLTNINDQGQEGLELAYNNWLNGEDGEQEVLIDRFGHAIANVALIKKPKEGNSLTLSIDHRIQYVAYQSLKQAILHFHAQSGSVIVLKIKTGEILAMVNQPSYNPNNLPKIHDGRFRNRAVTDIFEPGSVIKPFNIALALESGKYNAHTLINTNPGWMRIGGYRIKDDLNYGIINLTQVLQKSSNIGAAKIMLSLPPEHYWNLLQRLGFGLKTHSGFPGEANGSLKESSIWYPSVIATMAYGYGIAVSALQLAHAYAILANHGMNIPVTFIKIDQPPTGNQVIAPSVADKVIEMMKSVVNKGGTGTLAEIPDYQVAGKTGTAYIAGPNGYDRHKYMASFIGVAPASDPKLVVAVVIRDPKLQHFGGLVAAPVFSKVMSAALRILDIPPDGIAEKTK